MKRAITILFRAIAVILCILLGLVLLINFVLILKGMFIPDRLPYIFGYAPLIVQSGSMEPGIEVGDMILIQTVEIETLKEDDIVTFWSESSIVTHRIVQIQQDDNGNTQFVTRGDYNNTNDRDPVSPHQVAGRYVGRIPGMGKTILFLQSAQGIFCFVLLPLCLVFLYSTVSRHRKDLQREDEFKRKNRLQASVQGTEVED